eukprot:344189-Prorocentrum_lima.AAC.1
MQEDLERDRRPYTGGSGVPAMVNRLAVIFKEHNQELVERIAAGYQHFLSGCMEGQLRKY